jgi:hypothetical protein
MVDLELLGLLITVRYSRENGEVCGRPGGSGTAGSLLCPLSEIS